MDLDDAAAAGRVLKSQLVIVVVELLQAGARVAQPDAFGWELLLRSAVSPWPLSLISIHSSSKTWRVEMRIKPGARRGPMPWRMAFSTSGCRSRFGTSARQRMRLDVHLHLQPVLEACLLNVNVLLQEGQLAAERDFVDAHGIQREAQQVGQLQRHVLGGQAVIAGQRGDRVQGVEQEVRLELDLQAPRAAHSASCASNCDDCSSRSRYLP